MRDLKVAIIHDMLTVYGGAERVLEAILEIFPRADLYTSVYDLNSFPENSLISGGGDPKRAVGETPWQGQLFGFRKQGILGGVGKTLTLLYPLVFERYNFSDYDLVISSSSNFAKGIITPPGTTHISYIHTPPRFLYHYSTEGNWRNRRVIGNLLRPIDSALRVWDYQSAQRADYMITNSQNTAKRIEKYYQRETAVIYPPVEMVERVGEYHSPSQGISTNSIGFSDRGVKRGYYLAVSRLSKYKNIDLVIEAAALLPETKFKIVGTGPELEKLKAKCRRLNVEEKVELLGFVNDEELIDLYTSARALICPTEDEDFGITPVEAMACGTPVVALQSGGYQETVVEGQTGIFFDEPRTESLVRALQNFDPGSFDSSTIRAHARKFSKSRFQREFHEFMGQVV